MEKTELCKWKDENMEDGISQLPDEILSSILSFLTLKQACTTSVLSHRWKHLWQFFTGSLNFDYNPDQKWELERNKIVKRVNHILQLHRGSTIDEFKLCFKLDEHSINHIDGWIDFAISKRVKKLELNFSKSPWHYTLTQDRFTTLMSLTLMCLHVNGEILEQILSNCPLLERLHFDGCRELVNLKVCGSSLKLKYLHIFCCLELESIEIFAPNLGYFCYVGPKMELHLNHAPLLLNVHIGGMHLDPVDYVCPLSSYLYQLESLILDIIFYKENLEFPKFQTLNTLRHLKCKVDAYDGTSLVGLIPLIEAAPFLHKFTLEMLWHDPLIERELRKVMSYPNEHLKQVEIVGFVGRAIDIELVVYLLESAIKLEKIVINPRDLHIVGTPWETEEFEINRGARECAKQLTENLPPGAELVIL